MASYFVDAGILRDFILVRKNISDCAGSRSALLFFKAGVLLAPDYQARVFEPNNGIK
ncbi:MAG TPA: hypothetical protein VGF61_05790 [Candidatus Acidoferrum sp.]|jgi:hypothetical protein